MKFSLLLYIDTFIPFLWICLRRRRSDFPSTLVISEKLDFFEIPSKLLEKVLLEIQPSQLVMPSILVSSRKKRLKIHHCHLHYLPPQSTRINMVGRSTNTCHHPSPLAWPSVLLHYSLHCNATSWNCTIVQQNTLRIICMRGGYSNNRVPPLTKQFTQ